MAFSMLGFVRSVFTAKGQLSQASGRMFRPGAWISAAVLSIGATLGAEAQISTPYPLNVAQCTTDNDVSVSVGTLTVTDICTSPSDTFTVNAAATMTMNSSGKRYDLRLGLYNNTTGQILSSNCFQAPTTANFGDLDGNGDCPDIQNQGSTVTGTTSFVFPCSVGGQPVTVQSASVVVGFAKTGGNTLNGSSEITGGSSEVCKLSGGNVSVPFGPVVRLKKLAQGTSGSFTFNTTNVDQNPVTLSATTALGGGNFESTN